MIVASLVAIAVGASAAQAGGESRIYRDATGPAVGFEFTVKHAHAERFVLPWRFECHMAPAPIHLGRFVASCTIHGPEGIMLVRTIHGDVQGAEATGTIREVATRGDSQIVLNHERFSAREEP
jgi:hypothetical protein